MLSSAEIRHTIESGFSPLSCRCELTNNGALTVKIYEAESGRVELFVTGIALSEVQTSRDIARLVAELRTELTYARLDPPSEGQMANTKT